MKRQWMTVFFLCMCIIMGGCASDTSKTSPEPGDRITSDDLQLPQTLIFNAEFPSVYPSTAALYEARFFCPTEKDMQNMFMHEKVIERSDYVKGIGIMCNAAHEYYCTNQEIGQASYGVIDLDNPIFPYIDELNLEQYALSLFPFQRFNYDWDDATGGEYLQYPDSLNLDMTDNPCTVDALSRINGCKFPNMELLQVEVYTKELMQSNLEIRNGFVQKCIELEEQNLGYSFSKVLDYQFTEENEFTRVRWIQVIDNIPVTITRWTYDMYYYPMITLNYDSKGLLRDFDASFIVQKRESMGNVAVMSPQEAFKIYLADYCAEIHFESTIIYDFQLEYVLLGDDTSGLWLRPVWAIFTKTYEKEPPDSFHTGRDWEAFTYWTTIITADTGVILMDRMDRR